MTVERSLEGCPEVHPGRGGQASRLERRTNTAHCSEGQRSSRTHVPTLRQSADCPQGRGLDSTPTALRLCVTQPFGKHVHVRASVEPFVIAPGDATCSCRWGCHCANLMWVLTFRWPRRSVCKPCNTFVFGATHCFDPKCYIPQCDYPFCCCICLPQIWNYLQASHLSLEG